MAIATLDHFENDMIGLGGVVPHGNGLVTVRIERMANGLNIPDAVALEQSIQLFQCHFYALAQGL